MKKPVVNAKGQVVIPARLRQKYGIKKGTVLSVYESNGEIMIRPRTQLALEKVRKNLKKRGLL